MHREMQSRPISVGVPWFSVRFQPAQPPERAAVPSKPARLPLGVSAHDALSRLCLDAQMPSLRDGRLLESFARLADQRRIGHACSGGTRAEAQLARSPDGSTAPNAALQEAL